MKNGKSYNIVSSNPKMSGNFGTMGYGGSYKHNGMIKSYQTGGVVEGSFDPEGRNYDYDTARKYGMEPEVSGKNKGHWGSVAPASPEDRKKYNLPDESYMILKGRTHETWNKAVAAEKARGFTVRKYGNRYFSVPETR